MAIDYRKDANETTDAYYLRTQGQTQAQALAPKPIEAPAQNSGSQNTMGTFDFGGMTSSFSDIADSIKKSNEGIAKMFPNGDATDPSIQAQADTNKNAIRAQADSSRSDIALQGEVGQLKENKALDLLQLGPAAIRSNIDQFNVQSKQFHTGIANAIVSLDASEQQAIQAQDTNAAAQIRQQKMDFYTLQRQATADSLQLMTSAFNMMLTGKQEQRQQTVDAQTQASNQMNAILGSYGGKGLAYESLPSSVRNQLESNAKELGIPLEVLKQQVTSTVSGDLHYVREGDYTSAYDKNGKRVVHQYAPGTNTSSALTELSSVTVDAFNKDRRQDGYVNVDTYLGLLDLWKANAPTQLRTFFLSYDPTVMLNPKESDPKNKAKVDAVLKQATQYQKNTTIDNFAALLGFAFSNFQQNNDTTQ